VNLVSASRRTDIPAFYSTWFLNRVRRDTASGSIRSGDRSSECRSAPEDAPGSCSGRATPRHARRTGRTSSAGASFLLPRDDQRLREASGGAQPGSREGARGIPRALGRRFPPLALWRYDPILLSEATGRSFTSENFSRLARQLDGHTERCYFSFADFYGRRAAIWRGPAWNGPSLSWRRKCAGLESEEHRCGARDRTVFLLRDALLATGVRKAHCVDLELIEAVRR